MPPDSAYDYQPRDQRRSRCAVRYVSLTVGLALLAAGLIFATLQAGAPHRAEPAGTHPAVSTTATSTTATSTTATSTTSATSSPDRTGRSQLSDSSASPQGGDANQIDTAAAGAESTVRTFLAGWLTRDDPVRRTRLLNATATDTLAAELRFTEPAQIPAGPVESLELVGASATSAQFTAALPGTSVRLLVVADPEAGSGWRVTSIDRAGA